MPLPKLAIGQTWLRKDGTHVTVTSQDKEGYFFVGGLYYFSGTNGDNHSGPSLDSGYNLIRLLDPSTVERTIAKLYPSWTEDGFLRLMALADDGTAWRYNLALDTWKALAPLPQQ